MTIEIIHGDCMDFLPALGRESIDAVVCDPPYHLTSVVKRFGKEGAAPAKFGTDGAFARASRGFMGQTWDGGEIAFQVETWRAVYDAMKPGAHLVAFGGSRTFHRMAVAIEDAGFELRDTLMWLYGSGMPKSHNVSKAIDKALKKEGRTIPIGDPVKRMIPGADQNETGSWIKDNGREYQPGIYVPATEEAAEWEGWGTALKPSFEPIILARKPVAGTVVQNVLEHGTGAINIDACRVPANGDIATGGNCVGNSALHMNRAADIKEARLRSQEHALGRWPANVLHDCSDEVEEAFAAFGDRGAAAPVKGTESSKPAKNVYGEYGRVPGVFHADTGTASRFFYAAKANKHDRAGSNHPTVKPVALMRWLCRLVTPPGGIILDPFAGSGTTGAAAQLEGFNAILIEQSAEYVADIQRRFGLTTDEPSAEELEAMMA